MSTSILARFVGGAEDGKTRLISHAARFYMVPVRHDVGHVDGFKWISLDEYGAPLPSRSALEVERYRLIWFDGEDNTVIYRFERVEKT